MTVTIYHNPRCSKSRATLALIEDKGITPTVIAYLDTPPSVAELKEILRLLGKTPRQLLRHDEAEEFGLNNPALSEEELLLGMVAHPIVIERPIVVAKGKAILGRPPENVLEII